MIFRLNPPSGYPNSYLDIKFTVEFDKAASAEISFVNEATGQSLDVISSSIGYIREEKVIVIENAAKVEGYINLFNDDRMNSRLSEYVAVDITCSSVVGNNISKETVSFFNEAKSIDAGIIPFDLTITNPVLNVETNDVLEMAVVSDEEKKYEIAIRPPAGNKMCTIDLVCKKGVNTILVPSEILYSDLGLDTNRFGHYSLYFVKFEGLDFNGYVNRHYIPIAGTDIQLNGKRVMPIPQKRIGPDGSPLPKDFILSDRYMVPTWKDFTALGRRMENVMYVCNFPRFLPEIQNLREQDRAITAASVQIRTSAKTDQNYDINHNRLFRYVNTNIGQRSFFEDIAGRVFPSVKQGAQLKPFVKSSKSGGCGCSRKK